MRYKWKPKKTSVCEADLLAAHGPASSRHSALQLSEPCAHLQMSDRQNTEDGDTVNRCHTAVASVYSYSDEHKQGV